MVGSVKSRPFLFMILCMSSNMYFLYFCRFDRNLNLKKYNNRYDTVIF